jgi:hypothetical protein
LKGGSRESIWVKHLQANTVESAWLKRVSKQAANTAKVIALIERFRGMANRDMIRKNLATMSDPLEYGHYFIEFLVAELLNSNQDAYSNYCQHQSDRRALVQEDQAQKPKTGCYRIKDQHSVALRQTSVQ